MTALRNLDANGDTPQAAIEDAWLAWVLIGIAAAGVFIAVLAASMLSSQISRREEEWHGG